MLSWFHVMIRGLRHINMSRRHQTQKRVINPPVRNDRGTTRKSSSTSAKLPTSRGTLLRLQRKKPRFLRTRPSSPKGVRQNIRTQGRKTRGKTGRTVQSHQRNPNRGLRARKTQNRPPRNETLERLQLKEILQVTQNPNLDHNRQSFELGGYQPHPTAQSKKNRNYEKA